MALSTDHYLWTYSRLLPSPLPSRGPSPVIYRKQRQEGGQRLWQSDIYLPGSAGTQPTNLHTPEQTHRHAGRRAGLPPSAKRGLGPVWLPVQAVVGSDKGHLPGTSIMKLGSFILLPHPSKRNSAWFRGTWASLPALIEGEVGHRHRECSSLFCC